MEVLLWYLRTSLRVCTPSSIQIFPMSIYMLRLAWPLIHPLVWTSLMDINKLKAEWTIFTSCIHHCKYNKFHGNNILQKATTCFYLIFHSTLFRTQVRNGVAHFKKYYGKKHLLDDEEDVVVLLLATAFLLRLVNALARVVGRSVRWDIFFKYPK